LKKGPPVQNGIIMDTISEAIEKFKKVIEEEGYNPKKVLNELDIRNDADLIVFALSYLRSNILDAIIEPYEDDAENFTI
jgi:hypothetical protein